MALSEMPGFVDFRSITQTRGAFRVREGIKILLLVGYTKAKEKTKAHTYLFDFSVMFHFF